MIVFSLLLLICTSATECRWTTAAHFVREDLCRELGEAYFAEEPTVRRYKCHAVVRE